MSLLGLTHNGHEPTQLCQKGVHVNYTELVPVPPKNTFNLGLKSPGNQYMLDLFGHPVKDGRYSSDGKCTQPNNPALSALLVTQSVGPFRATGLRPAVQSLRDVLLRVQHELPDLYAMLGSSGMLCSRFTKIRQPDGKLKIGPGISNHSWGAAIDINVGGKLDRQGDGTTQRGLLILSSYFNAAGWYWGAAFTVEDAMHFEASKALLARWKAAGEF
nr:Csw004 [uncultured bacterium]